MSGLGSWTDSGNGFRAGVFDNTRLRDGAVVLGEAQAPVDFWKESGQRLPPVTVVAYDAWNDLIVGFGGGSEALMETWVFDLNASTWTRKNPAASPPGSMEPFPVAFDERTGRTIHLGGKNTWAYDAHADTWENQSSTWKGKTPNVPAELIYDRTSGEMVCFGWTMDNWNDSLRMTACTYDDTNNCWEQKLYGNAPFMSYKSWEIWRDFGIVYDSAADLFVMFLSTNNSGTDDSYTYTYNLTANAWTRIDTNDPPWRKGFSLFYDEAYGATVLQGGSNPHDYSPIRDAWTFRLPDGRWSQLNASEKHQAGGLAVYDSHRGLWVYPLGGSVWTFDLRADSWRCLYQCAPGRESSAMAFDSVGRRAFVFGGGLGGSGSNDTWSYDPFKDSWTEKSPAVSPPSRYGHAMSLDGVRREILLVGGMASNQGPYMNCYNDTWVYNLATESWVELKPVNGAPDKVYAGAVYDSRRGNHLVYGGWSEFSQNNSIWAFNITQNNWTSFHADVNPGAWSGHAMVYDSASDRVVLFGSSEGPPGAVWTFDPGSNIWANLSPPANRPESPPSDAVFCPSTGAIRCLVGGNATWDYMLSANTWTNVTPAARPPGRSGACMAYDPNNDELILFSGRLGETEGWAWRSDTWILGKRYFLPPGWFTSAPFDAGGPARFGTLRRDAHLPPGTALGLQLRTAVSYEGLFAARFLGPDGTAETRYTLPEQYVAAVHDGNRWVQYRASLDTADQKVTPFLYGVRVGYNLVQRVEVLQPAEKDNWSGQRDITWNASDLDGDALLFDLYLEDGNSSVALALNLSSGTRSWNWDVSKTRPGTYRIKVCARDDNPSIPVTVSAMSGNFTVPAPPQPNRPPHVELVWPPDRSVMDCSTVRLLWNGTDPDGDPLNYTVLYSNLPLSQGHYTSRVTQDGWFFMANLADETIYYWTVDASDGRFASTDVPAGEWSFLVRLGTKNHRPRLTSLPPTTARVCETYSYCLTAQDEDLDALVFSLVKGPANMTMNPAAARLIWVPAPGEEGFHGVTVRVSDGRGGFDEQTFDVEVTGPPAEPPPPERPPECRILYPSNGTVARGIITARGTAHSGTRQLAGVRLRVDGGNWTAAGGLGNWTLRLDTGKLKNGRHTLEAQAFDGELESSVAAVTFETRNPGPGTNVDRQEWCLPASLLLLFLGLSMLPCWWKRRRSGNG